MQFEPMSLGEFERRYGVNRGTVKRRANELGHDTAAGLSAAAVADLFSDLGLATPAVVELEEVTQAPSPAPGAGAYAPVLGGLALRTAAPLATYSAPSTHAEVSEVTQSVQSLLATSTARTAAAMGELHRGAGATGRQLGALLGAEIVNQAEATKAEILAEYLQSQGIAVGEPPASQVGA
jgi:hypothetical protein